MSATRGAMRGGAAGLRAGASMTSAGFRSLRNFDKRFGAPAAGAARGAFNNISKSGPGYKPSSSFGKHAMGMGLEVGLSGLIGHMTYDKTKHSNYLGHIGAHVGGGLLDAGLFSAAFAVNPILGFGGIAASFALGTPGMALTDSITGTLAEADEAKYGKRPMEQNRRTINATRQQMSLLGQGGSALGNEAMHMHN